VATTDRPNSISAALLRARLRARRVFESADRDPMFRACPRTFCGTLEAGNVAILFLYARTAANVVKGP
jgi:hypothetical protein